jgi:hypothetical protein
MSVGARRDHAPVAVADYTDLFATGLGFDITGAVLVAQGLRTEPDVAVGRTLAAGNSFAAFTVRAAEDFADGKAGVRALVAGFLLQAIGYALSSRGLSTHTDGWWAAVVAVGCTAVAVGAAWFFARKFRWQWVRRWLIEYARWDRDGSQYDDPDGRELLEYARVLGRARKRDYGGEDAILRHAREVWGVDPVRYLRDEQGRPRIFG